MEQAAQRRLDNTSQTPLPPCFTTTGTQQVLPLVVPPQCPPLMPSHWQLPAAPHAMPNSTLMAHMSILSTMNSHCLGKTSPTTAAPVPSHYNHSLLLALPVAHPWLAKPASFLALGHTSTLRKAKCTCGIANSDPTTHGAGSVTQC
jgi:hypothetical protein